MTFTKLNNTFCPTTSFQREKEEQKVQCRSPRRYHCLKNQFGRLGYICEEPTWIQAGMLCLMHCKLK